MLMTMTADRLPDASSKQRDATTLILEMSKCGTKGAQGALLETHCSKNLAFGQNKMPI